MFQSIRIISFDRNNKHTAYKIIDTDFESVPYTHMLDIDCLYPRLVMAEYSKRNLNVVQNLKRYYQFLFKENNIASYRSARSIINSDYQTLDIDHYRYLKFSQYYDCLIRDLKRLEFIGLLK